MIKNWLVLGSVAFGVGFSISLPLTRNIKDSILLGLVAVPSATAGAYVVSRQQKREIGMIFSSLQAEVLTLEEQKETLRLSIAAFRDRQNTSEEKQTQLDTEIEQLQALLDIDKQQKQEIQQELTALTERKDAVETLLFSLQPEVKFLQQQQQSLNQMLVETYAQKEQVEVEFEQLKLQKTQIQSQIKRENQQRNTIRQELVALQGRRQSLAEETDRLEARLHGLELREEQLNLTISAIADNQTQLDDQLSAKEKEKQAIQQELAILEARKRVLNEENCSVENQLKNLQAQVQKLEAVIARQSEQAQNLYADLSHLNIQIQDAQQQKSHLTQQLENLSTQRDSLDEVLRQLQDQIKVDHDQATTLSEDDVPRAFYQQLDAAQTEKFIAPTVIIPRSQPQVEEQFEAPDLATEFRLNNPKHTLWLWESVIIPRWQYPRFLGSVCLPRHDTDDVWGTETILNLVGDNLRRLGTNNLEYNRLCEKLGDEVQLNWLKILTFAISEYAYYTETEGGFWKGLCERLELPYQGDRSNPVTALQNLALEGINYLNLPKAVGGYPIISTLWLQSGIPYRNLNHFADLVADLETEFGWNYLVNASAELLAQKLLTICQSRYPGRTVLGRFLEYGCRPQTEPVSGKLLQSIAGVALALREYNLQPQDVLLNPSRRQEFLLNVVPQFNFFLRDWEALIQILTPQSNYVTRHRQRHGQFPLALKLDLENLFIELVLPEQTLCDPDWIPCSCQIQDVDWQGDINSSGQIEIEECTQIVYQISEGWHWQLLDDQGNCLRSWYLEGITSEFPCLIFDAWTGDRLRPDPQLTDSHEIFYFASIETVITFTGSIELAEESLTPCSIQGWHGKRLRLNGQSGTLSIQSGNSISTIVWTVKSDEPKLRGLKLRGQNPPYLETPTLWYPPNSEALSLTLTLQERFVESNPLLIQHSITIPATNQWFEIPLSQWIDRAGHYSVNLTAPEEEWSKTFEIQSSYQVTADEIRSLSSVQITDIKGTPIAPPLIVNQAHQFWSSTLLITGLWTLEPIKLLLSDGRSQTSRTFKANASGHLRLDLSTLYDVLPFAKQYSLEYQRLGEIAQRLVQLVEHLPLSWSWDDRALELTGLRVDQAYKVNYRNLLNPQHPSVEIPIIGTTSVTISLNSQSGVYCLQLETSDQSVEFLSWWCGHESYNLPAEIQGNQVLENYCHTILNNALIGEFQMAAAILSWDKEWIELITTSLETSSYHFPDWLNVEAFAAKLQSILAPLNGSWYKICTTEGKRADFREALKDAIIENNLWHLILDFRRHRQRDERNIAFVYLTDIETIRPYLSCIPYFEWMSRSPLNPQEVEILLEIGNVE